MARVTGVLAGLGLLLAGSGVLAVRLALDPADAPGSGSATETDAEGRAERRARRRPRRPRPSRPSRPSRHEAPPPAHDPVGDPRGLAPKPAPQLPIVPPPPPVQPPASVENGEHLRLYGNGNVRERGFRVDGKFDGAFAAYFRDGRPRLEGGYRMGRKHGRWTVHYPEGGRTVTEYAEGEKHGLHEAYRADGSKKFAGEYSEGEFHGTWTSWHENGTLLTTQQYWHGEQHGLTRVFYANGYVENEYPYVKGKLEGRLKGFHDNGRLEWEIDYVAGKRHGAARWFDREGRLTATGAYADNQLHGAYTAYGEDGSVLRVEHWERGRCTGAEAR